MIKMDLYDALRHKLIRYPPRWDDTDIQIVETEIEGNHIEIDYVKSLLDQRIHVLINKKIFNISISHCAKTHKYYSSMDDFFNHIPHPSDTTSLVICVPQISNVNYFHTINLIDFVDGLSRYYSHYLNDEIYLPYSFFHDFQKFKILFDSEFFLIINSPEINIIKPITFNRMNTDEYYIRYSMRCRFYLSWDFYDGLYFFNNKKEPCITCLDFMHQYNNTTFSVKVKEDYTIML